MLTEINGNIDATYPIITGELTGYLGPIGTVTASADNSVGTPHVIVTQTPTPDGLDIDFAFKEMGIPGLDLTVEQDLTEEQQQTARENIEAQEVLTFDAAPTQGSQNPVTSGGVYNSVEDINAKIPAAASAQNKLADKEYVDDSINRTSAFFRGNFATYADLMAVAWQTTDPDAANYVSNNDYAFVAADETHSWESWRYIYVLEEGGQDNGWAAQYRVNESPLTPEQLAALNSGITSQGVSQIETNRQGLANHVSNTSNPHQVTKAQVGLGNVDNTSDANKPVSTAQQAALDAKQDAISSTASVNSDKTPYLYRRAGGGVAIGNRAYSKLIGATIANNQLHGVTSVAVDSPYRGVTFTISADGRTISFSGTATQAITIGISSTNLHFENGHKYLILGNANDGGISLFPYAPANYRLNTSAFIWASDVTDNSPSGLGLRILNGTVTDGKSVTPQIIDLTADFGSTIADYAYTLETQTAGSGIAWLKSYGFFSKYAPYDAGSLISTKAEKKKVVGFNLWDEEWQLGGYKTDDGAYNAWTDRICTKNVIPVLPNTVYYCKTLSTSHSANAFFYDADGAFLSYLVCSNRTVTTPNNCAYMRVTFYSITSYTDGICINISDASKNGTYAPYASQEYDLGSDELRGLFKLDNGNIYADGDIKTPDGVITRKYALLEMSDIAIAYNASLAADGVFPFTISGMKTNGGLIAEGYVANTNTSTWVQDDMTIVELSGNVNLRLKNSSFANYTAAQVTAALSGKYLVYELATPTTEQGTPYQNPQEVFADGTEEFIDTRTVPVPVGHETDYPGITYLVSKLGNETAFSPFASDIPPAPTSDGTYVLQVSVSSGTPFFRWVTAAELVGE